MAEGLNRVMLLGNLGADPELRYTKGGQAVLKLRLATNESYQDRDGGRKERTEWHHVTVWGKRAEALGKFLAKGATLFVEGSLRTTSWEGQDGQKRYRTEISASNILLTGGRSGGGAAMGGGSPGGGGGRPAPTDDYEPAGEQDQGGFGGGGNDDDIPF